MRLYLVAVGDEGPVVLAEILSQTGVDCGESIFLLLQVPALPQTQERLAEHFVLSSEVVQIRHEIVGQVLRRVAVLDQARGRDWDW